MTDPAQSPQATLKRRAVFAGAGATAAVAAVAAWLPTAPAPAEEAAASPKAPPERGGGYALSEHVKQYYQTARV